MTETFKRCPQCDRRHAVTVLTCDCGTALTSGAIVNPTASAARPSSPPNPYLRAVIVAVVVGLVATLLTWKHMAIPSSTSEWTPEGFVVSGSGIQRGWPFFWYDCPNWYGTKGVRWGNLIADTGFYAVPIAIVLAVIVWRRARRGRAG